MNGIPRLSEILSRLEVYAAQPKIIGGAPERTGAKGSVIAAPTPTKQAMRESYPKTAEVIDKFRELFGSPVYFKLSEDNRPAVEWGKPLADRAGFVPQACESRERVYRRKGLTKGGV